MKNRIITIAMALVALFGVSFTVTAAQSNVVNLLGSEIAEINCDGKRLVIERTSKTQVMATCRPSNDEPTPADLAVVDLILVNADTDQDIGPLADGSTVNLNELGTQNLNVRAETQPSTVGSVRFSLDDNTNFKTENIAPYAIAGDNNGRDYNAWSPSLGEHTLTVTPFTKTNGQGTEGTSVTVTFTVTNDSSESEPTDPPSSSVPLCEDHDPTQWHPLYDAEKNCHYNHEHKDDPHLVDDIFGSPGTWFNSSEQELSYPWQTFSSAGVENELKHEGYGWLVRRDIDCNVAQGEYCITDLRTEYHAIMASIGATTRFHSFSVEARLCRDGQCGILKTGGWADYNVLTVDDIHVPLANDGDLPPIIRRRDHRTGTNSRYNAAWYGAQKQGTRAFIGLDGETWGLVTAEDPTNLHLYCPDFQCDANGSTMQMHVLDLTVEDYWDGLDGTEDGLVTLDTYTDRYGNFAQGCTEPGLDCVPLQLTNVPVGNYQYRDDEHGIAPKEYDTSPSGEYWITFPN